MKLKIKVDPKDFIYFVLIAVVLLFGCFILSANFISLSFDGELVGINVFQSLNSRTILLTFILFIGSMLFIFFNVSSTIFDFDKGGPGLSLSKKEDKGYNRFLTAKEMKRAPNIVKIPVKGKMDAAGTVFINDGKHMWVDNSEHHTLIIGMSGSGKTSALVDPQVRSLIGHSESMVITDPKGEIYRDTAANLKEHGYKIVVVNFREPTTGNSWNPLTVPYKMYKEGKTDKAKELLEDIAQNILISKNANNDPFWETSAADYFTGFALSLFNDAKENEVNITSVSSMISEGEQKNGLRSTFAKDYFDLKGENSAEYQYAKGTLISPDDTRSSILAVAQSKLRAFASREQLSEMLSYSDFNMDDIGKEKTAVFLIVHDEKKTYHPLATIFIKQLYEVLIDVAHKNPSGKLKYRTNFILDEFANMPELKDVDAMVTAARSRLIRFTFIIQNFAQLDDVYGEKKAETIRSNCANLVYLLTNELAALEKISKLCGEVKSKENEKTVSTPLVTVTDLEKMKKNEIIVIRSRMAPFRTVLKATYEIDWGKEYEKSTVPEREVRPLKIFDIKQFVKVHKKKQTDEKSKSLPSGFPGFGGGRPNFDQMFGRMDSSMNSKPTDRPMPKPEGISSPSPSSSIDFDNLIKSIDKQIEMLEKKNKNASTPKDTKRSPEVVEEIFNFSDIPAAPVKPTKPENNNKLNVDSTSVLLDNKIVTDDEYFDDFFGDDDL